MRKIVILLCVLSLVLLAGSGAALNHFEPEDLNHAIVMPDGPALPVLVIGDNLLISSEFELNGAQISLPVVDTHIDPNNQASLVLYSNLHVQEDGLAYISLTQTTEFSLEIPVEPSDYDGILEIGINTEKGKHRGQLLILPLVNYPEGTEGYVVPILEYGGALVLPMIHAPRGHFMPKNPHSENPWGFEMDLGLSITYI